MLEVTRRVNWDEENIPAATCKHAINHHYDMSDLDEEQVAHTCNKKLSQIRSSKNRTASEVESALKTLRQKILLDEVPATLTGMPNQS